MFPVVGLSKGSKLKLICKLSTVLKQSIQTSALLRSDDFVRRDDALIHNSELGLKAPEKTQDPKLDYFVSEEPYVKERNKNSFSNFRQKVPTPLRLDLESAIKRLDVYAIKETFFQLSKNQVLPRLLYTNMLEVVNLPLDTAQAYKHNPEKVSVIEKILSDFCYFSTQDTNLKLSPSDWSLVMRGLFDTPYAVGGIWWLFVRHYGLGDQFPELKCPLPSHWTINGSEPLFQNVEVFSTMFNTYIDSPAFFYKLKLSSDPLEDVLLLAKAFDINPNYKTYISLVKLIHDINIAKKEVFFSSHMDQMFEHLRERSVSSPVEFTPALISMFITVFLSRNNFTYLLKFLDMLVDQPVVRMKLATFQQLLNAITVLQGPFDGSVIPDLVFISIDKWNIKHDHMTFLLILKSSMRLFRFNSSSNSSDADLDKELRKLIGELSTLFSLTPNSALYQKASKELLRLKYNELGYDYFKLAITDPHPANIDSFVLIDLVNYLLQPDADGFAGVNRVLELLLLIHQLPPRFHLTAFAWGQLLQIMSNHSDSSLLSHFLTNYPHLNETVYRELFKLPNRELSLEILSKCNIADLTLLERIYIEISCQKFPASLFKQHHTKG